MSLAEGVIDLPLERARLEQDIRDLQTNASQQSQISAANAANIATMSASISAMQIIVRDLNNTVQKAKGALIVIGVISSALGAVAGWFSHK